MAKLHLKKVNDPNDADGIQTAVSNIFDFFGFRIREKGEKILLKPNFCSEDLSRSGVVTNLNVLSAIASEVKRRGGTPIVVESDSIGKDCDVAFGHSRKVVECEHVKLDDLECDAFETSVGKLFIPKMLFEHRIINIPCLKTHFLTSMSCAMKNIMGLLVEPEKIEFHKCIDDLIVELDRILGSQIELVLLDLTYYVPGSWEKGKTKELGYVGGSKTNHEADLAMIKLANIGINGVEYLKRKLYSINADTDVEFSGDRLGSVEFGYYERTLYTKIESQLLALKPIKRIVLHPLFYRPLRSLRNRFR